MRPSSGLPAPAIDVRALSKLHGPTAALLDVTFSVASGDLVAVIGAPGSGKTTLLRLLAGHVTPTGGRIRLGEVDVRMARLALTSKIGYVPQVRPDCGNMRPRDLLEFSARARHIRQDQLNGRIERVAAICELEAELQTPCGQLGTHARARVALAQAILHEPSVLLLDAFHLGLDDGEMLEMMRVLTRLRGHATLLVTGPVALLAALAADRALLLEGGRLAFDGLAADLSPATLA